MSPKSVPTPAGGYSNVSAFQQNSQFNQTGRQYNMNHQTNADLLMLSESPRLDKGQGSNHGRMMTSGPQKVHMNTTAAIVALQN